MSRRLLVVDRYDAPALSALNGAPDAGAWDVLLLGRSNPWYRWQCHGTADAWRLIDPTPFATAAAERTGDFLVDLLHRLPEQTHGGVALNALMDERGGSLWWLQEITEKGPFRGPLVGQLYRLALIESVLASEHYAAVRVALADAPVADVVRRSGGHDPAISVDATGTPRPAWEEHPLVRYWIYTLAVAVRTLAVKLWAALWFRPAPADTGRLAAFTFYPAWWTAPFSGRPADRFFSSLPGETFGTYLAWISSARALWRNRRGALQGLHARRLHVLQTDVTMRDLWRLISLRRFARVVRLERRYRPALSVRFGRFDVSALIGAELSRSATGGEFAMSTLIVHAVGRAARRLSPAAVLYRLEFQPFENALVRGLHGLAPAVGFLHYPFGRHYLSTRFAGGEVAGHLARRNDRARPLPDGVIACGASGVARAVAAGFPRGRCTECGPQRFGRLLDYHRAPKDSTRERLGWPLRERVYFVTLAIVAEDTEALFGAAAEALKGVADYRLIVRTHPNRPEGDPPLRAAMAVFPPGRLSLMDPRQDIYDHMAAADALICIGSMIAFEAMALGCMPIVFENPSSFPALSLADFTDGLFVARDDRELAAALASIAADDTVAREKRARWPALLSRVLGDRETPLPAQLTRALGQLEIGVT